MFFQITIPRAQVIDMAYELNYQIQDHLILPPVNTELVQKKITFYHFLLDELTRTSAKGEDCVFNFTEKDIFRNVVFED